MGSTIRQLRLKKGYTQAMLANELGVSSKAISKWETGKGYPDISLIEPLTKVLGVSIIELLSGDQIMNHNRSFQMKNCSFYICPICGNILISSGTAVVSCCGITLIPEEAELPDAAHAFHIEMVEDEYFISITHEMSRSHNISFFAAVNDYSVQLVKLYPESNAETRFKIGTTNKLYAYCNRHGLFSTEVPIRHK